MRALALAALFVAMPLSAQVADTVYLTISGEPEAISEVVITFPAAMLRGGETMQFLATAPANPDAVFTWWAETICVAACQWAMYIQPSGLAIVYRELRPGEVQLIHLMIRSGGG